MLLHLSSIEDKCVCCCANAGIPDYGKVITIKPVDKEYGIER
jgi:methionine synthase I (cobalamin-dependent)